MLYQLCEAAVCLTVSWYDKLSIYILGDDKMTASVVAPVEEMQGRWIRKALEKQLNNVQQTWFASLVGQDVADGFITEANEKIAQGFISQ